MTVLMQAFVFSKSDCCNAMLFGLPKKSISSLQLLQNSAAGMLTRSRRQEKMPLVLKSLHCLSVHFMCYSLQTYQSLLPVLFRNSLNVYLLFMLRMVLLLLHWLPVHSNINFQGFVISVMCILFVQPHGPWGPLALAFRTNASFYHYSPRVWNSLPENLRATRNC